MTCSYCQKELTLIHPWNTKFDLYICLNPDCLLYRQPQGQIENPRNSKMFEPPKGAQSEALLWKHAQDQKYRRGRYAAIEKLDKT